MCGIVGVISRDASTLRMTVDALKRLEYRGYDSFGVSVLLPKAIETRKAVGSVTDHDAHAFFNSVLDGTCTIAHTRWATHGGVTEANAHPHVSFDGRFSLVHNGVIENYRELREELLRDNIGFHSETDTEVIVHLLARHYRETRDVLEALRRTVLQLRGEFAIVFVTLDDPSHLYGARNKSPLGFGQAKGIAMAASDQRAIGLLTAEITFLEDREIVVLSPTSSAIYRLHRTGELRRLERPYITLPWTTDDDALNGYPHHMIKEIHEAPTAAERVTGIKPELLSGVVKDLAHKDISITGSGSAYYVSQIGQYYFAQLAKVYVRAHPSDELLSLVSFDGNDHLIAVSQSGETFDTLEAIRAALNSGSVVTSINNVYGSSAGRLATHSIFQGAGTEICVLSTKSIVSQTLILFRIAAMLARERGLLSAKQFAELRAEEERFPSILKQFLISTEQKIKSTAGWNRHVDNWFFIGRGIHYPVAMESALKFKEVSYLHAEGMPAGFFKHGTISLIDEHFYTVAFLPGRSVDEDTFRFTVSNISEIHARGGNVIAIGHDTDISQDVGKIYDYIALPSINRFLDPIIELVAGQLLAYHCAASLGPSRHIDKPRALAKSVTVR